MNTRTTHEAGRYHRLYAEKGYPSGNPERLVVWAGANVNESVIDLGCGRATLARIFTRYTGVDFTGAGFPKGPSKIPLVIAPLDELPDFITAKKYGLAICADVMEHIVPEDVGRVLASILSLNARRVIFSICCRESNWKDEHGGLHLTVQPPAWWVEKIKAVMLSNWNLCRSEMHGANLYVEIIS